MKGKRLEFLLVLALFLTVVSVNIAVVGGGFLWDDFALIVNNEHIRSINLKDFFTKGFWENAGGGVRAGGYYRPLILLSYALDYKIYKLHPWGYHLTNFLVFLISVLFLFLIIRKIEGDFLPAFLAALFFGIHPMAKEPMGWIAGRTDLFAGFFLLLSLYIFLHYMEKKRLWLIFTSLSLFLFAMLSKEASYIYPLFLVALVLYKYRREIWKTLPELTAFSAISLGVFLLSVRISLRPGAFYPPRAYNFIESALKTLGFYFSNALVPFFASPVPDFVRILSSKNYLVVGILFLLLLLLFPIRETKKIGFYTTSGLIFLVPALAPIILTTPTPIANRFAYISLFFLSLLPFLILEKFLKKTFALLFVLVFLIPVGSLSLKFSTLYSSEGDFWATTYKMSPNSPVVHVNYSSYLIKTGKPEKALSLLKTLSQGKNVPLKLLIIKAQVEAKAYFLLGEFDRGEKVLIDSLQYPFFASKDAFLYLMNFYSLTRQMGKMEKICKQILDRGVDDPDVYHSLAYAEILMGKYSEAEKHLKRIKEEKTLKELEALEKSLRKLETKAEKEPYSEALLLFLRGDIEGSLPIVKALLQEDPHNPDYLLLYMKEKVIKDRFRNLRQLLDFIVENARSPKVLDNVFSYFWFQWMAPKPAVYVLEKNLEKFPSQPNFQKKRIILSYIKEEIQGG